MLRLGPITLATIFKFVGGDQPGAEGVGEVLALCRAHAQFRLEVAPGVSGAPVVHDHVARDVAVGVFG